GGEVHWRAGPGPPPAGPLPIPSRAKLEGAVEAVRKQYQDDYAAASTTKAKRALARKLLEGAGEQKSPERVYAALDEARRLAAETGDATTALSAVAELNDRFRLREAALANLILETLEPLVASPGLSARDANRIASLALSTARVTLDRKDYDRTARLGKVAAAAAARIDDDELKTETEALQKLAADLQSAAKKLATDPDDPEANDTLGVFWGFVRDQWETGLPFLSKSSDVGVREAAAKDLHDPSPPKR